MSEPKSLQKWSISENLWIAGLSRRHNFDFWDIPVLNKHD